MTDNPGHVAEGPCHVTDCLNLMTEGLGHMIGGPGHMIGGQGPSQTRDDPGPKFEKQTCIISIQTVYPLYFC